jgi:DNA polymerase III sliding clamp (beta) subunit (PCNA family)
MSTIEQDRVGLTNSVSVQGLTLLELLEGASTHADKGKSALHALNSVQLLGGAGSLIARGTDRYRLIEGKIEGEGHLDHTLISLDDVKRVIETIKSNKLARVTLTRISDLLTVSLAGSSLTLNILSANYPNSFGDLFAKSEGEPIAVDGVAFNPALMADYAKIAGKGNAIKIYFNGENKPMRVRITGDKITWRALLMPMKYTD